MVKLDISKSTSYENISRLLQFAHDQSDSLGINIYKQNNDLIVNFQWKEHNWPHELSYKVKGVKDLIGSFLGDHSTTDLDTKLSDYTKTADLNTKLSDYINTAKLDTKLRDYTKTDKLDTKLRDYTRTDGSNITDDIQNKLMSHHTAQVFDFFSNLETEYNAMNG